MAWKQGSQLGSKQGPTYGLSHDRVAAGLISIIRNWPGNRMRVRQQTKEDKPRRIALGLTAHVDTAWFGIGVTSTGSGQVTVTGSGFTLIAPGYNAVGAQGNGHLTIQNGAAATMSSVAIGNDSGGQGEVIVSDPGSSMTVTGTDFQVGSNGNGTLTVQNGGAVVAHGVQIGARTGTGTFNLTGGTLDNNGGTILIGNNGTLTAATGTLQNVGQILGGSGQPIPLIKATLGTLVLAGMNSYSGGTDVEIGTLQFNGAAALPPGSNVTAGPSGVVVFSSGYTGPISAAASPAAPVPEPGTLLLLAAGSLALILWRSRNRTGGEA
jgi:T5SS/PEP-CTERM-associated repeat protein/autotransporter-associated beta strand protein